MKSHVFASILVRIRRMLFVGALSLPAWLGSQACFAYLSQPLNTTYIISCGVRVTCNPGQNFLVTTSPVTVTANGTTTSSVLIDYIYQTQPSGTVPAYIFQCDARVT